MAKIRGAMKAKASQCVAEAEKKAAKAKTEADAAATKAKELKEAAAQANPADKPAAEKAAATAAPRLLGQVVHIDWPHTRPGGVPRRGRSLKSGPDRSTRITYSSL